MRESGRQHKNPVVAVFDVCDTLYATNTTVGFLQFIAPRRDAVEKALERWTSRRSPFFYAGALLHRLLGHDLARARLVAALRGIPRSELEAAGRRFAEQGLRHLANAELHERLRSHRKAGDRVLLLSNSLDVVIAPVAEGLGVEYRASELEFKNGICCGSLKRDLTGQKAKALKEAVGDEAIDLWVYTDNRSDLDILALADVPTIVLPRERANREWGGPETEYIRL